MAGRWQASRMGVGRRLIGWIAAYALVLHATFAGIVATHLAATNLGAHGFEICLTDPAGKPIPAGKHAQHENCAIHCNAAAGGAPATDVVAAPVVFPAFATAEVFYAAQTAPFDLLRRDGLGSRAPPTA